MRKAWCTAVLVLGVLASAPSAQAQTKKINYTCTITDLGALGSPSNLSGAYGINNLGQLVGGTQYDEMGHRTAFLYDNGVMLHLGGLGSPVFGHGKDINDWGQIVGQSGDSRSESQAPHSTSTSRRSPCRRY